MPSPWGLSYSTSYREPAPKRLRLEELLGLDYAQAAPAPRPAPVTSVADLQGSDRREAQTGSLWAGLAALGANLSGDRRGAVAGMGDIQAAQDRALAGANARQDAEWQQENERRAGEAAQAKHRQESAALYGMYERAVADEDPSGPYAQRAEAAARAGSMAEVEKLADPEVKAKRAFVRSRGGDPDAYADVLSKQEELKAEIARAQAAAAWEADKPRVAEKAKLEADAEVAKRVAERDKGVLWEPPAPPQYEPLDRIAAREELVQSIRDKHQQATGGGGVSRIGQLTDGTWAEIHRADASHPKPWAVPIDGQPEERGNLMYYVRDGVRLVHDKNHPELGSYPLEEHEGGPIPFGAKAPPPAKPPAPAVAPGPGVLDRIKAAAGHAVDFSGGAPAAAPKKAAPAPKTPAAPPVDKSQQDATKKLSAVQDPGVQAKIRAARAAGYSEGEIAAYLGIH